MRWRVPVSRREDRRVRHQLHVGPGDLRRLGVEHDRAVHLRHLVEHRRRVVDVELDPAGEQVGDVARGRRRRSGRRSGSGRCCRFPRAARRPGRRRRGPSVAGDPDVLKAHEAHPQAAMTSPSRMAKTALECGLAISEWTGRDHCAILSSRLIGSEVEAAVMPVVLELAGLRIAGHRGSARRSGRGRRPR